MQQVPGGDAQKKTDYSHAVGLSITPQLRILVAHSNRLLASSRKPRPENRAKCSGVPANPSRYKKECTSNANNCRQRLHVSDSLSFTWGDNRARGGGFCAGFRGCSGAY